MRLDLLGRSTVIHISDKNTPRIDLLLVLCQVLRLLIKGGLHLAQFCGFGFHLCYSCFHRGDFFLLGGYLSVTVRLYREPGNSKWHKKKKVKSEVEPTSSSPPSSCVVVGFSTRSSLISCPSAAILIIAKAKQIETEKERLGYCPLAKEKTERAEQEMVEQ